MQLFEPGVFLQCKVTDHLGFGCINTFTINSIFQRKRTFYFNLSALLPNHDHSKKFENTTECQAFYAQTLSVIEEVVKISKQLKLSQNVLFIFSLHIVTPSSRRSLFCLIMLSRGLNGDAKGFTGENE